MIAANVNTSRRSALCGILLVAFASAEAAPPDGWPMLGHDAARSGATPVEIRPPFERQWYRLFPDEGIMSGVQPVIAGGRVYVGTLRGVVHAIDAETGQDAWTFKAGGPILHACAADDERVFFGAADGTIYALDAKTGRQRWTVPTGAAVWNAPALHDGLVLVGSRDGRLYAIDAASGAVRWSAATGGPLLASPAIDASAGRAYVGSEDMHVYAFALTDGRQLWRSEKLPGVSFRGYHPVIAPDGSILITVMPCASQEVFEPVLLDMVKEVFGDFASWRHSKEENEKLRKANFELMARPETYTRQLDYLRRRLEAEPALQTFFVLDPRDGKKRCTPPIIFAESMNGPGAPPIVTADPQPRVIVKYQALLRSRYEHYSPFLNVGYLDTASGHITPVMDQSRTYGWHDSLLLVHDEQSQLSAGGRVLFNTHQDNVNAMDLDTLQGYGEPMCRNVHEVQPGTAAGIWSHVLAGTSIPVGWEWLARGTAVYGGGSVLDVPIAIAGDRFYYLPTHEINAGVAIIAYCMKAGGRAAVATPAPKHTFTAEEWEKVLAMQWDWDMLSMPRLNVTLEGLPAKVPGTRQQPLTEQARTAVAKITDAELDAIIWEVPPARGPDPRVAPKARAELIRAVEELISTTWKPLVFPAGKHPNEAYRFFTDPIATLYTLALAYPALPPETQAKVKAHVGRLSAPGGPLSGPLGQKSYAADAGEDRSLYDPAPDKLLRFVAPGTIPDIARIYPLWAWAQATGDWERLTRDWPQLREVALQPVGDPGPDCDNAASAGLIAACRLARRFGDEAELAELLPRTRALLRRKLVFELAHAEGGLIVPLPSGRSAYGRWMHLTPEVGRLLAKFAGPVHRRLMDVYVDHHRTTWWLAWNVELLWRNESPLSLPSAAMEVFAARAQILGEPAADLARFVDLPWCRGDEYHIRKLALLLR